MRRAVLVILAVSFSACGGSSPTTPTPVTTDDNRAQTVAALQSASQSWRAAGLVSYRYVYRRSCFCLERGPVAVTVRAGRLESVTDLQTGEAIPPERWPGVYTTVDGLFAQLFEAVAQRAWNIRATYDERLGYPREGWVDRSPQIADEELGFSVADLEPL